MSEVKHTPGPWEVLPEECDKSYMRIRGTRLGSRFKIANVLTPIYDGAHELENKETRANANLIATAPDFLELAQELYALMLKGEVTLTNGAQGGIWTLPDRFGAAIARATEGDK